MSLKTKVVNLTNLPGCQHLDKNIELMMFESNPLALKPLANYVMDKELFEETADQIGQRLLDITTDGLHFSGPVGCGKSTTARQLLAYLNYPTQVEVGHEDLEYDTLCGRLDPVAGVMGYVDGPLKTAYEKGHAFLFEEREKAPARTNVALNTILDGAPMHISQIGRSHRSEKEHGFLFISTGNAAGGVDMHGNHPTAQQQDVSTEDRFDIIEVDYCDPSVEAKMINQFQAPTNMVDNVVEAANICRSIHASSVRQKHADAPDIVLTLPVTYRGTQRILRNLMYKRPRFSNIEELTKNVLKSSLNLEAIMPEEKAAIIEIFQSQLMKKGSL